jgi:hypothetical protein
MKKNNKTEKFINKAINKFGNRFDYSEINYVDSTKKIKIKCNEHNEFFEQTPADHLRGKNGCNYCTKNPKVNTESFINKAKEKHGNKYDYSLVNYIDSKTKIKIICPTHGVFEILPNNHLKQNCPYCYNDKRGDIKKLNTISFIEKAKEKHNDKYDYSLVNYIDNKTKIRIICPVHGEFEQLPYNHLRGKGCGKCAKEKTNDLLKDDYEKFLKKSIIKHGDKYDYSLTKFENIRDKVDIICPIHGRFEQSPYIHYNHGCPSCGSLFNYSEKELKEFIINLGIDIIENTKKIINPLELDIFMPSHNLAIEYNGLYWHSDLYKDKNYHLNKTELCEAKGIQLIHIFEDEWLFKKDIVKSRLKNILGLIDNKIYARKTVIREVSSKDSKDFLNTNHIQGYINSSIKLGLYYNDELVSLMVFGNLRKSLGSKSVDGVYELLRFCNKLNTSVIGGADKLLQYFIKTHKPKEIISYADRRWSRGNMYEKLLFTKTHTSKPNYFYVVNDKRENRFNYRKDVLVKEGYDKNKTEYEIMKDRGINRIYDCGSICFKKTCS